MIISSHSTLPTNYSFSSATTDNTDSNNQPEKPNDLTNKEKEVSDLKGAQTEKSSTPPNKPANPAKVESELIQEEVAQLRELRQRDREVRTHEQAHVAAAGNLAKGGPSFDYKRGPDGQLYAVGGEVQIDTSTVSGDPEATAKKAQQVRRAALAPADPSQQDRSVAAAASAVEAHARVEIAKQRSENATDIVNDRFSNEQTDEVETKSSEVESKCAECGGQHSAASHTVATTIAEAFKPPGGAEQKGNQFSFAI